VTPQKVLAWYEEGKITSCGAVLQFCGLAATLDPATFAEMVPAEWLADIRERTVNIATPDNVRIVWGITWVGSPGAYAAWEKAERERYVAGLRTWKAYFESVERTDSPTGEQP
jgi:hypothetical protein